MPYERDNIRQLTAYTPGEQPQSTRLVKLNTNENPYPPCPAVLQAIASVSGEMLRRYPPPTAAGFRQTAAQVHEVSPQNIIATNGGDELLRMAITVFCEPRRVGNAQPPMSMRGLGVAEPSYSLYPVLADIHDTPIVRVPLDDHFALPDNFAARLNDAGCGLAMIVNPHAPSGRLTDLSQLRDLADAFQGVLLIDEAYVDFAQHDALALVREGRENVLLLRTLSKGYSLAGLRFGYGIGHADLIAALDKARDSYNTDVLSQAAAVAALQHRAEARQSWQKVIAERQRITQALVDMGFTVQPSESNFLLAAPPPPADARQIYESLKKRDIFVRYFDQDRLRDKLRITIGTAEQNNELLTALKQILATDAHR